jgi:1-acyl-sn-glycerol-3-phosphate acyltransferase
VATNTQIVPVIASELHKKVKLNRWNNGTVIIEVLDPVELDKDENPKALAKHFHSVIEERFQHISKEAKSLDKAKV